MSDRPPRWWPSEGAEPDARWSLANERTFLAYERTALGLVVAGFALAGTHALADTPSWLAVIGLPFIGLGAVVGLEGRARYVAAQRAMRTGEALGPPRAVSFLPVGIAVVAAIGFVVAAVELIVRR